MLDKRTAGIEEASPPTAISLTAALHPGRGLLMSPESAADELRRFLVAGWPCDAEGRRHGEAVYDLEWLPVEITVRFSEGWLRRVEQAQAELLEIDRDLRTVAPPPPGLTDEQRVAYWEAVEKEHRFFAREQAVLAVLDADAGPKKLRREWDAP